MSKYLLVYLNSYQVGVYGSEQLLQDEILPDELRSRSLAYYKGKSDSLLRIGSLVFWLCRENSPYMRFSVALHGKS